MTSSRLPSSLPLKTQPRGERPPSGAGEGRRAVPSKLKVREMETSSPLPHPSDSSFHDNKSSFLGVCGNLHFNGDVIRIKKLSLEGMGPFLATWNLNHPSTPHPSPPAPQPYPDTLQPDS